MSRQWKEPNHSLPGWGKVEYCAIGKRARKRRGKCRKFLAKGKSGPRYRKRASELSAGEGKRLLDKYQILRLERGSEVLLSRWFRHRGKWRCIEADPLIEWFTRLNNPELAQAWIEGNNFTRQWLPSRPSGSVDPNPDEEHPVDRSDDNAPQGDRKTVPSKNNPSPSDVAVTEGLEQNGVKSPRCLIPVDDHGT